MGSQKTVFITGITGQDGSYLAAKLLLEGHKVIGMVRRSSSPNTSRIAPLIKDFPSSLTLEYCDLEDTPAITRLVSRYQPHEIFNLAAQSHVGVSFECPEYTANVDAMGPLRFLEAIRHAGLEKHTRFYQASTSELYGKVQSIPQTEETPFYPRSPYGVAKLYGYWITVNYRESYGIHASNGVLFNHESPMRGVEFVTRKITRAAALISLGLQDQLVLGNLDAKRDWGHAREYIEGMHAIVQAAQPSDYVLATNVTTPVREFVRWSFAHAGITLDFTGSEDNEKGICRKTGKAVVAVSPKFYRPAEVDLLIGSPDKATRDLGWKPKTSVSELCKEMVLADIYRARWESRQLPSDAPSPEAITLYKQEYPSL